MDILTESDMAGIFASITDVDSANAYKVNCSFEKRLRVCREQILPDYLLLAQKDELDSNIKNIEARLQSDFKAINKRGVKEGVSNAKINELVDLFEEFTEKILEAQLKHEKIHTH